MRSNYSHHDPSGDTATYRANIKSDVNPVAKRLEFSWDKLGEIIKVDIIYGRSTKEYNNRITFRFRVSDLIRALDEESIHDRYYLISRIGGKGDRSSNQNATVKSRTAACSYRSDEVDEALFKFGQSRENLADIAMAEATIWLSHKYLGFEDYVRRNRKYFASS